MERKRREFWNTKFVEAGYDLRCGDLVFARKDAIKAAWLGYQANSGEKANTFSFSVQELLSQGEIPDTVSYKTLQRSMNAKEMRGTTFSNAWTIAVVLGQKVEDLFVLKMPDRSDGGDDSFERREILDDLAVWTNYLLVASGILALIFFLGLIRNGYDVLRGLLPLGGIVTVLIVGAVTRRRMTFSAPLPIQLTLGALFGNLSAVSSYVCIVLFDRNLMCDFANHQTLAVVSLYVISCIFAYPAGQAVASKTRDWLDLGMIGATAALGSTAVAWGLNLPPVDCRILF